VIKLIKIGKQGKIKMETIDWKKYREETNPRISRAFKRIDESRSQLPEECVFRKDKHNYYPSKVIEWTEKYRKPPPKKIFCSVCLEENCFLSL